MLRPLAHRRIMNTRGLEQAQASNQLITALGGSVFHFPCLAFKENKRLIINSLKTIENIRERFDVLFSSSNGVRYVCHHLADALTAHRHRYRLLAIGKQTAESLQERQFAVDLVASKHSQQGLIEHYQRHTDIPKQMLFYRAAQGSHKLIHFLEDHGCKVHFIPAYQSYCPQQSSEKAKQALQQGRIDAVLLASPKTAKHYLQRIGDIDLANQAKLIAISPAVAHAAQDIGLNVQIIAKQASVAAMLDAYIHFLHTTSESLS